MRKPDRSLTAAEAEARIAADEPPFGTYALNPAQRALVWLARHSPLHRGLFRHRVSRAVVALGGGRPLDVAFRGGNFRIRAENNLIEYGILLHPTYNQTDIDFLAGALSGGGNFADLGSNIGLYSLPLARICAPGRVVAIDANPAMAAQLDWHARASGLHNLTVVNCGVGDVEARGELQIRKDDVAIVSVEQTAAGTIRLRPLAAILAEAGLTRLDALKIDIEGFEDRALPPFLDRAPAAMLPRRIVIERSGEGDYPGCAAALRRTGYVLKGRTRQNSLYELEPGAADSAPS